MSEGGKQSQLSLPGHTGLEWTSDPKCEDRDKSPRYSLPQNEAHLGFGLPPRRAGAQIILEG